MTIYVVSTYIVGAEHDIEAVFDTLNGALKYIETVWPDAISKHEDVVSSCFEVGRWSVCGNHKVVLLTISSLHSER